MREMRSDDRVLTERLLAALSSLELADMRAEVRDGIAYLSGAVPSDLSAPGLEAPREQWRG